MRSEWCEWIDGCTWCPNGIGGCLQPHLFVSKSTGGFTYSHRRRCAPVRYALGMLCAGHEGYVTKEALAKGTSAGIDKIFSEKCEEISFCKAPYARFAQAKGMGLDVVAQVGDVIWGTGPFKKK